MSIIGRIGNMFKAEANDALDNMEDPIKLCNQKIRDMEEKFREAEVSSAQVIGNANAIKKQMEQAFEEVSDWEEKIKLAVSKGNDELAKKAIVKKKDAEQKHINLKKSYENAHAQAEKLKATLKDLNEEIEATRQKRDEFEARNATAEASQKVNEIMANVSTKKNDINLDDIERKIAKKEAMAEGLEELASVNKDSLEDEFEKLGSEVDLDAELAKYKK